MRFLIVGAGWYGCHAARFLQKKGHQVRIVDKNEDFFSGASSKNQNRLHLGFHYPRSADTIYECQEGFPLFMKEYGSFTHDVSNNLYFIHKDSKVDLPSFLNIFTEDYTRVDLDSLEFKTNNLCGPCLNVNERFIDNLSVKNYFRENLLDVFFGCTSVSYIYDENSITVADEKYDYLLNCTNNQWNPIPNTLPTTYEKYCTLLYEIDFSDITAITIMDGLFFSIYPYDIANKIYTVTHVKYGVLEKCEYVPNDFVDPDRLEKMRSNIEDDIKSTLPDLLSKMKYVGYFVSTKTKYDYNSDDRSLRTFRKGRYISFSGGKITGIFSMEKILNNLLQEMNGSATSINL